MTYSENLLSELNDRSREVFRRVVESYLSSGGPVGSRTLTRSMTERLSAATVRNVMQDLEHLGLLDSPHISAGRIPTQQGLRLFVDSLRDEVGGMFVVSATQVQYHRPARLDDLLLVTAQVLEAGRASLTIAQTARRDGPGADLLCEGTIRIGWVDAQRMKPQRMPAAVLQALGGAAHPPGRQTRNLF